MADEKKSNGSETAPHNTDAGNDAEAVAKQRGESKGATHKVTKRALSVHVAGVDHMTGTEIDASSLKPDVLAHYEDEGYLEPLNGRRRS